MKSIVGLFTQEADLESSVQEIQELGFSEDSISILASENAVRSALHCEPYCAVPRYAI